MITEKTPRLLLWALSLLAVAGLAASCSDDDSAGPEEGASIEDIAEDENQEEEEEGLVEEEEGLVEEEEGLVEEEGFAADDDSAAFFADPGSFVGQTVVVSGEVQQVMSERILTIGEEEHMLVLGANPPGIVLEPGQVAQIQGIVGVYQATGDLNAALEQAVGPNAYEVFTEDELGEIGDEFDQKNFILATNVDLLETDDETPGGGDDGLTDSEGEGEGEGDN